MKKDNLCYFSRFHIYVLIYDICLFLSDLLHSVWQSLGPSMSLRMTQFLPFYGWVIFHCIYIYHILFIHFSVDGHSGCFHVLPIVNTTHSNICLFTGLYVSTSDLSLDLKLIFMTLLEISTYLLFRSSSQMYLLLPNSCEYATLPIFPQSILRSKSINRY